MTNVSIYDPFYTRLNRVFNHLLSNHPLISEEQNSMPAFTLKMDVTEDDRDYLVQAELPGFKKEDIQVHVEGNQVSISAEAKSKKEEKKDKNVICSERYEGRIYRNFTLEKKIDESKAEAEFTDGVLKLTLPKKTGGDVNKQITVK